MIVNSAACTFRPQPVAPEAHRALMFNVVGSLAGAFALAFFAARAATPGLRSMFFGMIVATAWLLRCASEQTTICRAQQPELVFASRNAASDWKRRFV